MDYRKIYKNYYGIEFDKGFEVHHIDGNRNNNDIQNLLLLPMELHKKYHNAVQSIPMFNGTVGVECSLDPLAIALVSWQAEKISELAAVMMECQAWIDEKGRDEMRMRAEVEK